jgi:hypothetical protein
MRMDRQLTRSVVVQGRCSVIFVNADHDCVSSSWGECGNVESLDGVLQDASEYGARADNVDGRRTRSVIYGHIVGGKSNLSVLN